MPPAPPGARIVGDMEPVSPDVQAEIERIAALPPGERAAALEALEGRLRADLDEIPSA